MEFFKFYFNLFSILKKKKKMVFISRADVECRHVRTCVSVCACT